MPANPDASISTASRSTRVSVDRPELPAPGQRLNWCNLGGSSEHMAVVQAALAHDELTLLLCPSTAAARQALRECRVFAPPSLEILYFPDWETLPYDAFSPHQDIISARLATMAALPQLSQGLLIVSLPTCMQRTPPSGYVAGSSFALAPGDRFDLDAQRVTLVDAGYRAVAAVTERGEFAVRGSLLDLFPMGADHPIRIDLLDDEIDSLRTFDPDSQRTIDRLDRLELLPAREFPIDSAAISQFRQSWHELFDVDVRRCPVYQDISQGLVPAGIEYYLPLFFDKLGSLFDFLPTSALVIHAAGLEQGAQEFRDQVDERFESLRHDIERPLVDPSTLYLGTDELFGALRARRRVGLNEPHKHSRDFGCHALPDLAANVRAKEPAANLSQFVHDHHQPLLFVAESAGRREIVEEFLGRADIDTQRIDSWEAFTEQSSTRFGLLVAELTRGSQTPDFSVITEAEIYGRSARDERPTTARQVDTDQVIRNLSELHIGAAVVHLDHGVGRYQGLTTLTIDNQENEFLKLTYADEATLYVPVASLHLIGRYSGSGDDNAPLHRLGSDQWEKARRKAAAKAHDVAAELLNLYALRATRSALAFELPTDDYERFAQQFEFATTPDQELAIEAVLADLTSPQAMDRLVCGDVGFGKTEVAMRAAFVAVQNNKQVAVLVPTTLLAQQHGESFRDRFADWPVRVEVISRLRADSEVSSAIEATAAGKVDILIGTHKLLSKSLKFDRLGLVVVDEEHRFGVRQKERLKTLRAEVDMLTLTATPIPRTLNMAIGGIRDLSIIATPPARRLSIKTFVQEYSNRIVREAMTRELLRGGQVFYLHNEVKTIEHTAEKLAELVPEARVAVGHGQMPKRLLETVMSDFQHRRCNVLVCSTIIETGIDIPNANTIIIDRADRFGLAQLHQLRGRVGRSHHQAYAYLLTPHRSATSADAKKRLEAIEAAGDLGVGFTLATHDMEIRGAGELLGDGQSGQIEEVGFSMYMDMLERAVRAIKAGNTPNLDEPFESGQEINLHEPALIPSDYMGDVHTRLITYKRISSAADEAALDDLRAEIIDRFGSLPQPLLNLFAVTYLKLTAAPLGIAKIDLGTKGGKVEFQTNTGVEPIAIVQLMQSAPAIYRMDGATTLRIKQELPQLADRVQFSIDLLEKLHSENSEKTTGS